MADQVRINYSGSSLAGGGSSHPAGGAGVSKLPGVYIDISDGNLGLGVSVAGVHAKIGAAERGDVNRVLRFSGFNDAKASYGKGRLLKSSQRSLDQGVSLYTVRANASIAGSIGTVGASSSNTGTGIVSITGTPHESYDIRVEITKGGTVAAGDAAVRYSTDGGYYWSDVYALLATLPIGKTGLTLGFDTGNFVAGNSYKAEVISPQISLQDLITAFDALALSEASVEFVHFVGAVTPATAQAIKAKRASIEAATGKDFFYVLEARGVTSADYPTGVTSFDWDDANDLERAQVIAKYKANLIEEWKNFQDKYAVVFAGDAKMIDAYELQSQEENSASLGTMRLSQIPVGQDLGRFATGSLPYVQSLLYDENQANSLYHAGFNTLRHYNGTRGTFFTGGLTRAASTSDFRRLAHLRVCLEAKRLLRIWLLRYVGESVPVDDNGYLEASARGAIESAATAFLEGRLLSTDNASAVQVKLNEKENILTTAKLTGKIRIRPLGYLTWIEVDLGLVNPLLEQVRAGNTPEPPKKQQGGSS